MWAVDWNQQTFSDTSGCFGDGFNNLMLQVRKAPASLHGDRQTIAITNCGLYLTGKHHIK